MGEGDLSAFMRKNKQIPEEIVVKIFKDILSGFGELVK